MASRKIFFNLPIKDIRKSVAFWKSVGFTFNSQFTDDTAACLVFSDSIHAMLLTHPKFKEFSPKTMSNTDEETSVLMAISCDSREEVSQIVNRAVEAGGKRHEEPKDYGFMFQDSFEDIDGHCWAFMHMDPSFAQK